MEFDFLKDNIWALALLLWESLAGGSRCFEDCKVDSLLQQETPRSFESKTTKSKQDALSR